MTLSEDIPWNRDTVISQGDYLLAVSAWMQACRAHSAMNARAGHVTTLSACENRIIDYCDDLEARGYFTLASDPKSAHLDRRAVA